MTGGFDKPAVEDGDSRQAVIPSEANDPSSSSLSADSSRRGAQSYSGTNGADLPGGKPGLADALGAVGVACREVESGSPFARSDWPPPRLIAEPISAEQLAAALRVASEAGASAIPVGSGTKLGLGNPPRSADLYLSTAKLNRIVEHEPANLTAIVEAGMLLGDLQARLAQHGQFLPLGHLAGTIGGIIATNASGPLRLGYGTARDLLIGSRVATSDGRLARSGGKVVKNVAGYDLGKLYIGSLGTLGVLVELAFKLSPLPAVSATHLSTHADADSAQAMAKAIPRSSLQPLAADILSPAAAADVGLPGRHWTLAVLVGGVAAAVRRQTGELGKLATQAGGASLDVLDLDAGDSLWRRVSALGDATVALRVKASVPIAAVPAAVESLSRVADEPLVWARAGSGIVYARWQSASPVDRLVERLARARREAVALGGALVLESAPPEVKARLDVWGEVGDSIRAMRALKAEFDPRGTLNPGRFVGGI